MAGVLAPKPSSWIISCGANLPVQLCVRKAFRGPLAPHFQAGSVSGGGRVEAVWAEHGWWLWFPLSLLWGERVPPPTSRPPCPAPLDAASMPPPWSIPPALEVVIVS